MKKRVHVWVYGLVKSVSYRASVEKLAKELALKGFVRNLEEGVEAVFEGDHDKIEEMIAFCKTGPKFAKVEKVDIKDETFSGEFKDFRIWQF